VKRDFSTLPLDLGNELIIDNFAGGGGTSTGLEAAFGRPVDIAINHDPEALAMHAMNHPHTKHLCESVWDVDPIKVTNNQPVGLVWLSPDCKHFSKAKGGKPVEKKIRGLAWVALRWAAKCKPRVIMLENVEEFQTWGPLLVAADGSSKPDPARRGTTFRSFVRQLQNHGYTVDHRELRACDFGTPTIRKRFFLVARRDGLPIRWPVATHGAPTSPGVLAGKLLPYRTAAECIDWSLPCPSIFERTRELAPATMRRIAKGIMRYVVNAEKPFIVGAGGPVYSGKPVAVDQPFGTLTTENHRAVVVPSIVPVTHQGGDRGEDVQEPMRMVTGAHRGDKAPASATLVQVGYGERAGQAPRALDIGAPVGTLVASGKHALVTAFLNEHANATNQRVMPADEPLRTICAQVKGGHFSLVSAVLTGVGGRAGQSRPRGPAEPLATITSKADGAVATAFLAKHYTGVVGSELPAPIGTVTSTDHHSLVTSTLVKLRGTSTAAPVDEPLHTVSAGGQHHAEVRAFLLKYYGTDQDPQLAAPLHTVTTKDRYGLVTIYGQDYQIVDIGPAHAGTARVVPRPGLPGPLRDQGDSGPSAAVRRRRAGGRRRARAAACAADEIGPGAPVREQRVPAAVGSTDRREFHPRTIYEDCSMNENTTLPAAKHAAEAFAITGAARVWLGLNHAGHVVMWFTKQPDADLHPALTIREFVCTERAPASQAAAPAGWDVRRHGPVMIVQKPGVGGYLAEPDSDDIASSILFHFATDVLAGAAPVEAASPELRRIGELLRTQDNRYTDQPMFIVQQKRRITGIDTDYCEDIVWMNSEDEYAEASEEEAARLEGEYQAGTRSQGMGGWTRTGYMDQWEFVTACFTEQGCKDYLRLDGHNLKETRIYADGSYRNNEFRAVRNWLMSLAAPAPGEAQ
jgi:DNA (cytosine-5)-methyltransferase 1